MHRKVGAKSARDTDTAAGGEGAAPAKGSGSAAAAAALIPRLTFTNLSSLEHRRKPLPPDAESSRAIHTSLYQFRQMVRFGCAKCRRENVESDSVAIDTTSRIMLCTPCFARIVRPRSYRPTRVVPFPSLLSWLEYRPAEAQGVAEDVLERPGEAVAPSGDRIADPLLEGGSRPLPVSRLPANATMVVPTRGAATATAAAVGNGGGDGDDTHPCLRVWRVCEHGSTCFFRNAPYRLCLAHLMGLCDGGGGCTLLHEPVYDLPPTGGLTRPSALRRGDVEDEEGEWARWIADKKRSANRAEWQLWNNGPVGELIEHYVPHEEEETVKAEAEAEAEPEKDEEVKLNVNDIMSALRGIDST